MSKRGHARATLRDVARAAGVSMMSVSNVVNGRFGAMTAETRARIETAIAALGYRPHIGARGLRRGQRFSLALLVVDRSPTYLAEPWMSDLVAGMTNHLIGRDYGLYVQGINPASLGRASLLENLATDGLCVLLSGPEDTRQAILERVLDTGQPVVLFQEVLARVPADLCVVRQDDRQAARRLAELVLRAKPRRLAILTTAWEWPSVRQRELGIRDAVAAAGGEGPAELAVIPCGDGGFADTADALADHARDHELPDAILAGSDTMGVAALRFLAARGFAVPEQVQVAGFGGFDLRRLVDPPLTTMRSPAYQLGEAGSAALLARLETGSFPAREIVLPVEPVAGLSTRWQLPIGPSATAPPRWESTG